jgi:hypothetical protein
MNRTAPPVHVLVDRFPAFTAAQFLLWVLAACSLAAWFAGWFPYLTDGFDDFPHWFALGASLTLLAAALWFSRLSAVSLRWDGEQWWLGDPSDVGVEPWCVQPRVRVDLGDWMLLQLEIAAAGSRLSGKYRWLALQRWGHATQWHGLRCALLTHSPRRRGLS